MPRRMIEMAFDETLWNAVPQSIKNRYGHCTGNWFRHKKTGVLTFVAEVPESDVQGLTRDIMAFIEKEQAQS